MALSNLSREEELSRSQFLPETQFDSTQPNASSICWAAIFAGAAAAAVLSLILLLLGAGLGLSSISPWSNSGISASAFGLSTIIWITVTQILAAGMGGYLAGRLRIRWSGVQQDEVYFRDTAHGFLAWAVATLATVALLASAIGSIVNMGVQSAATLTGSAASAVVAGGVIAADTDADPMAYFVDALFRQDANFSTTTSAEQTASAPQEVTRIFVNALRMESLPPEDLTYISQLVSSRTGLTQEAAESRVNDIYTSLQAKLLDAEMAAKEAADKARKASIYSTLWLFVSLLMGAFSASLAATWGGRCRDT